jgi:hypothetical protein
MSTRCHILFRDEDDSLLTYKHSDGYPEAVIPLLRGFWQWYPRTERLEYLTATWFYYCKRGTEERLRNRYDAPTETDELTHNHPVALSYGICVDNEVHGDIEHFYEVDIEDRRITHYTPEGIWFEDVESSAEIINREPERMYSLNLNDVGASASTTQSSSPESGITDGGETTNLDLSGECAECGSIKETNWVVQAGSPAGRYLGLSDGETTILCDACMRGVAESIGNDDENARNESTQGGENER